MFADTRFIQLDLWFLFCFVFSFFVFSSLLFCFSFFETLKNYSLSVNFISPVFARVLSYSSSRFVFREIRTKILFVIKKVTKQNATNHLSKE